MTCRFTVLSKSLHTCHTVAQSCARLPAHHPARAIAQVCPHAPDVDSFRSSDPVRHAYPDVQCKLMRHTPPRRGGPVRATTRRCGTVIGAYETLRQMPEPPHPAQPSITADYIRLLRDHLATLTRAAAQRQPCGSTVWLNSFVLGS